MPDPLHEMAMGLRGAAVRGVVLGVADGGGAQLVDVETHEGLVRQSVPVAQPYGLAASPPDGAVVIILAMGADQGDLVALPALAPGAGRMGGLAAGEVAIYDAAGNRVHIRQGGIVEVIAATKLRVVAPLVEIVGDLTVTGQVNDANGSMQEMRDTYNSHRHAGGALPTPTMA